VRDLTPAHTGIFEGTPIVNDEFLDHVRTGQCEYVRGDTKRLTRGGVLVNVRGRESKPGDEGEEVGLRSRARGKRCSRRVQKEFQADLVVLATGFEKPKIDFLPEDLFPEGYEVCYG
jgi:hypothetical protein